MTTRLTTIFSTGTPGAARGALDAAAELKLAIGGWTAATDLPPEIAGRLRQTLAPRMAARLNVQDSDGTLIVSFAPELREGSPAAYADDAVQQQRKPSLHIVLPDGGRSAIPEDVHKGVLAWIAEERIATLHVTGPRESDEPGIQQAVHDALVWIFEDELGPREPRATFAGVDRTDAPEPLAGAMLAAELPPPGSVVDTIARIAADLPNRLERPPLTTEDALRQVASTGSEDARDLARDELARRTAVWAARGLDPPPVPPEVWPARDQLLAAHGPASLGVSQEMLGAGEVTREEHYRRLQIELPPSATDPAFYLHRLDICRCGQRRGDHDGTTGCAFVLVTAHDPRAKSLEQSAAKPADED